MIHLTVHLTGGNIFLYGAQYPPPGDHTYCRHKIRLVEAVCANPFLLQNTVSGVKHCFGAKTLLLLNNSVFACKGVILRAKNKCFKVPITVFLLQNTFVVDGTKNTATKNTVFALSIWFLRNQWDGLVSCKFSHNNILWDACQPCWSLTSGLYFTHSACHRRRYRHCRPVFHGCNIILMSNQNEVYYQ